MKYAILLMVLLASCTQGGFEIDASMFSQKQMAHSASIGTMYLTSSAQNGAHNCDDSPSGCCASGYHMCTFTEVNASGRQIEDSGTGRDTTPYSTVGWVDAVADISSIDCTGWSLTSGSGFQCSYSTSGWSCSTSTCTASSKVWCCSP